MQYFVIWNDGQKFGPADVTVLNEWVAQGRITPTTELESVADGSKLQAGSLPGLNFGAAAADSTAEPVTPVAGDAPAESVQPVASAPAGGGDQFFVIGPDGSKYGPADVPTLSQWAADSRLSPSSELENAATGVRTSANMVAGLIFPVSAGAAANPVEPAHPGTGGSTGQYSQAPSNYPRADYSDPNAGKTELIVSFVMSAIGLLCCPCIFSVVGIVLGNMAMKKGNPNGKTAMILGIVSLVLGFVIGAIVNMNNPALQQLMQGR